MGCQSQCRGSTPTPTTPSPSRGTGIASYYVTYTPSACFGDDRAQFPPNKYFAAAGDRSSANLWKEGKNCSKRFRITCASNGCKGGGPIAVKVVDRCPNGCSGEWAFDLSREAFSAIANPA